MAPGQFIYIASRPLAKTAAKLLGASVNAVRTLVGDPFDQARCEADVAAAASAASAAANGWQSPASGLAHLRYRVATLSRRTSAQQTVR